MKQNKNIEEMIEKAKRRVEYSYYGTGKRVWKEISMEDLECPVKLFVLTTGVCIPRGYVILNTSLGIAKAFGEEMRHIHTYRVSN